MKKLLFILISFSLCSCITEEDIANQFLEKNEISSLSEFTYWNIDTRGPGAFFMRYTQLTDSLVDGELHRLYIPIYAIQENSQWTFTNILNKTDSNLILLSKHTGIKKENIKDTLELMANKYNSLNIERLDGSFWNYPMVQCLTLFWNDNNIKLYHIESGSLKDYYAKIDSLNQKSIKEKTKLNEFKLLKDNWYLFKKNE